MANVINYRHDLLNDKWVSTIVFPGLRNGFFIEAGATNGVNGSGTYILEKEFDWQGICVEPIPSQCKRIPEFRGCHSLNACLYGATGDTVEFSLFPNRSGHSGITTLNKNLGKLKGEDVVTLHISTITLHDLLVKFDAPKIIHYLCLDTEGSEEEILSAFDFNGEHSILAVSIEGHACDELMISSGYAQVENPFTDATFESYFVHKAIIDKIPQE